MIKEGEKFEGVVAAMCDRVAHFLVFSSKNACCLWKEEQTWLHPLLGQGVTSEASLKFIQANMGHSRWGLAELFCKTQTVLDGFPSVIYSRSNLLSHGALKCPKIGRLRISMKQTGGALVTGEQTLGNNSTAPVIHQSGGYWRAMLLWIHSPLCKIGACWNRVQNQFW